MGVEIDIIAGTVRPISVPATSVDVVVLPGNSYLCGWAMRDAQGEIPSTGQGSVTAPAAGATIAATGAVPAGEYTVSWTVSLVGAAAAADINNFALYSGSTLIQASVNLGAAGNYPQQPVVYQSSSAAAFSVRAIGAGTAGVEYSAEVDIVPTSAITTIVEIRDGARLVATFAMQANDDSSRSYGPSGLKIYTGLTVHVVQGAVTGAVMARFDKAS
jgi:hypothetical protein